MLTAAAAVPTDLTKLLLEIAETPAPTFSENLRAELIARHWAGFGLRVERDAVGNVIAHVAGRNKARVALVAHLDTVFEHGTDLTVRDRKSVV